MSFALRLSAPPTHPVPTRRDSLRQAEGCRVWELCDSPSAHGVFQRLMGNYYTNGNPDRPTTGYTGIHSLYLHNASNIYTRWPQTPLTTYAAQYVDKYLVGLPLAASAPFWWGQDAQGVTWPSGPRVLMSRYQLLPGSNLANTDGLLERNWLQLDQKTNSLTDPSGHWQLKQEDNIFFTGTETGFSNSVQHGKVMRGKVLWKTGVNLQFNVPTNSDPGDKSAHYFYVWHPDLGHSPGEAKANPSTQRAIRMLLDKSGRFAVHLPHDWSSVFVKSEQSLWRQVGFPNDPIGGTNDPPVSPTWFNWGDITVWRDLQLAYGDMDGDNVIEINAPAGTGGAMSGSATDMDQYNARNLASVDFAAIASNNRTIKYYHHGVDLNRDRTVSEFDRAVLLLYSTDLTGAQP